MQENRNKNRKKKKRGKSTVRHGKAKGRLENVQRLKKTKKQSKT